MVASDSDLSIRNQYNSLNVQESSIADLDLIVKNEEKTAKRIQELNRYFQNKKFLEQTNLFNQKIKNNTLHWRTVLPHIGSRYDCVRVKENTEIRILVFGREALCEKDYSIAARTEQILTAGICRFNERNPHMKGVTILLKYILRDICGMNIDEEEKIDYCHIFSYFALANWHIHGCFDENEKPKEYAIMRRIDAENFINITKILDPTIAILQGSTIYFFDAMNKFNKKTSGQKYEWEVDQDSGEDFTIFRSAKENELKFPVVRFLHPSQRNRKKWVDEGDQYFKNIIISQLETAIR